MAPSLVNESTASAHNVEDYPEARYSFPGLYPEPPLEECPEPIAIIGMGMSVSVSFWVPVREVATVRAVAAWHAWASQGDGHQAR